MNDKQIAFIICSNNDLYTEECMWYIQQLRIPDGYSIDVLTIKDANGISAGYNEAMNASKAMYKVYLHQDTFIINPDFIPDILRIFSADEQIGMLGVLGADFIAKDGIFFDKWNVGGTYAYFCEQMKNLAMYQSKNVLYTQVCAIDGMIMVTKQDVPWREDLLRGWDFYDISQSFEMQRKGFKVVIPYQSEWWCIHDFGSSNLHNYYKETNILLQEYEEYFSDIKEIKDESIEEIYQLGEKTAKMLIDKFNQGKIQDIKMILERVYNSLKFNRVIIYMKEILAVVDADETFIAEGQLWDAALTKYQCIRFLIMRAIYGNNQESKDALKQYCQQGVISSKGIAGIQKMVITEKKD